MTFLPFFFLCFTNRLTCCRQFLTLNFVVVVDIHICNRRLVQYWKMMSRQKKKARERNGRWKIIINNLLSYLIWYFVLFYFISHCLTHMLMLNSVCVFLLLPPLSCTFTNWPCLYINIFMKKDFLIPRNNRKETKKAGKNTRENLKISQMEEI